MASQYGVRIIGRVGNAESYKHLDLIIASLPVTVGRAEKSPDNHINHICIGKDDTTISRIHAKLFW